jgi:cAMP-dependent protein kinase regulator
MPDLRRLQDDALAAISAGDWAAAASLYTALEKAAPGEGTWSLKLGECLRKLGRQQDAVKALGRALQVYSRAKMRSKAAAVCRLILEIDPRNQQVPRVLERLSDLHRVTPVPEPPELASPQRRKHETVQFDVPASVRKAERAQGKSDSAEGAASSSPPRHESFERPPVPARPLPRVVLPLTPFLASMNEHHLRMVNDRAHLIQMDAGQILFALGDPADALFLLASGQIAVLLPQEVARLQRGDFFGEEVAVLPHQPRLATVRATENCQVLALERDLVDDLITEAPVLLEILTKSLRERLVSMLARTSPMLASLGGAERAALLARFHFLQVDKLSRIHEPGEATAGLFVLLAGEAAASLDGRMEERLQPGDVFGEISLVTKSEARTVVTARE